jgi:hypothetical protein
MANLMKKVRTAGLALVIGAGLAGCFQAGKEIQEKGLFEAEVGEDVIRGFQSIIYAGMNSESSFSLCYSGGIYGISSGINLYYSKSSEIINCDNKKYKVISVTPEKIVLQPLK